MSTQVVTACSYCPIGHARTQHSRIRAFVLGTWRQETAAAWNCTVADAGMQFSASTAIQEKSHHLKTLNKQQRYFRSIYFSVWGLKCKSDSCASWQDNSFVWLCMGVSITTLYIMFPINQFDERSAQQLSIAQSKKAVRSSGANLSKRPFNNCLRGSVTISRCRRR